MPALISSNHPMSFTRKIAQNTMTQIMGKGLSTILGLFTIGMMTRYLGQTGFGQYTTIMAFLQLAGILADLGLSLVIVQMISEHHEREEKIINNIFTFRFLTAVVLFIVAPMAALLFPFDPIIKTGIVVTAFSFLAMSLNQLIIGIFQKKLEMIKVAIAENLGRIVLLASVLYVIKHDIGLLAIMIAVTAGSLFNFATNFFFTRKWFRISFEYDREVWREIWRKSWPIGLSIIFNLFYFKADTLILSLTQTQADTGIYGATYKVLEVLITLPFMFLGLMMPFITTQWKKKNKVEFFGISQKAFDAMAMLAIPIVFGGYLLGVPVMTFVAGEEFVVSGRVLQILSFAIAFIFLSNVFTHIGVAIDRQKEMMWGFLAVAMLALGGYFLLIPKFSYWGAAWMTVIAEGLIVAISAYVVHRYTTFRPHLRLVKKSLDRKST